MLCIRVLIPHSHNLEDVQVDFIEGEDFEYHASNSDDSSRRTYDRVPRLGASIGPVTANHHASGSLGIYVKAGINNVVYATTCHHVAFPSGILSPPGKAYCLSRYNVVIDMLHRWAGCCV